MYILVKFSWKEFFKPSIWKFIVFLLLIFIFYFGMSTIRLPLIRMSFLVINFIPIWLDKILGYSLLFLFTFGILYYYILSSLIVFIVKKIHNQVIKNKPKNKIKKKEAKINTKSLLKNILTPIKSRVLTTLVLFFALLLGNIGIPPFGKFGLSGDVGYGIPNPVLIAPVYLLKLLPLKSIDIRSPLGALFIIILIAMLIVYYYLLSSLIMFIFKKIKKAVVRK